MAKVVVMPKMGEEMEEGQVTDCSKRATRWRRISPSLS